LADVEHRSRVKVAGRIHAIRVRPRGGVPALECTLVDGTGMLTIVFLGRRGIPGLHPGVILTAEGTVSDQHGTIAILNPVYEILSAHEAPSGGHH
jgi:hypothetical protein